MKLLSVIDALRAKNIAVYQVSIKNNLEEVILIINRKLKIMTAIIILFYQM